MKKDAIQFMKVILADGSTRAFMGNPVTDADDIIGIELTKPIAVKSQGWLEQMLIFTGSQVNALWNRRAHE